MKYQIAIKLLVAILAVVTNKNIARAGDTVIGVKTERSALSTLRSMLSEFKPEDLRQVKFVSGPAPTPTPFPTCTSTPSKDTYTCRTFSYNRGEGKDERGYKRHQGETGRGPSGPHGIAAPDGRGRVGSQADRRRDH